MSLTDAVLLPVKLGTERNKKETDTVGSNWPYQIEFSVTVQILLP